MAEHSNHHIVPLKTYFLIFGALMVGTALTVMVAKVDYGVWNILVAMTVAIIKATLVVLYFMHVRYSSRLTQVIVVAGVFWLAIMLVFTMQDYFTRSGWPVPGLGQ